MSIQVRMSKDLMDLYEMTTQVLQKIKKSED